MKKLYLFTTDNGDGSHSVQATFNKEIIDSIQKAYDENELSIRLFDADGFHYQTFTVPDECTAESMGFLEFTHEDIY